ncbi:hypothetical protein [Polyangium sorediatum]|uniref:Uncharacterized protein n=1 Tax=Polyangium sorediatum TaxID=889274 RepID=A0ABT6NRB5_9BACT|nr:hypothetical protein [Polyangium sorediatum]MDI1430853.1 hypothetical protein [Polyangium sorediatum]
MSGPVPLDVFEEVEAPPLPVGDVVELEPSVPPAPPAFWVPEALSQAA